MMIRASFLAFLLSLVGIACAAETPRRVLALCDPVQQQIVQEAARELKGQVQLVIPRDLGAYHSGAVLEQLDKVLGDNKWDVIYFNFGIADLIHRHPKSKTMRLMNKDAGGKPTSLDVYQRNIEQIVSRLKQTHARLIWGSTTPMVVVNFFPTLEGGLFVENSEVDYNLKAAEIMRRHQIPVVDLHSYIMKSFAQGEKHPPYTQYGKAMSSKNKPLHLFLSAAFMR